MKRIGNSFVRFYRERRLRLLFIAIMFAALPVAAALGIIGIVRRGADVAITFHGEQGVNYRLEQQLSLTNAPWQPAQGANEFTATSNGPAEFLQPLTNQQAFYRLMDWRGVFVDAVSGNDSSAGTRLAPKKTITAAITAAAAANPPYGVFVSKGSYAEFITLSNGVSIYGGYDAAAGWTRADAHLTTISSPTNVGVLAAGLNAPMMLQSLRIFSAHASGTLIGGEGLSSYGVLVRDSIGPVTLENVTITAGNGAAGLAGSVGPVGLPGTNGGNANGFLSGLGGISPCGAHGGNGAQAPNGPVAGAPGNGGTNAPGGEAGAPGGAGGTAGTCNVSSSSNGGNAPSLSTSGTAGINGGGGVVNGAMGILNAAAVYLPPSGGTGTNGTTGGGGGGGGSGGGTAHAHNTFCTDCISHPGGGGGGGGSGGCGGTGGGGGRGGGGSFAVAVVNSAVTIRSSTLVTGSGGNGGSGGDGGLGGTGGGAGSGAAGVFHSSSCSSRSGGNGAAGSAGGQGGRGGGGAGGTGGPSIGIFYKGAPPTISAISFTTGPGGSGGTGGQGTAPAPTGPAGTSGSMVASN